MSDYLKPPEDQKELAIFFEEMRKRLRYSLRNPVFHEGANSYLVSHSLEGDIEKNGTPRVRCKFCPKYLTQEDFANPKPESRYCKESSIEIAKIKGTFNPEYKE